MKIAILFVLNILLYRTVLAQVNTILLKKDTTIVQMDSSFTEIYPIEDALYFIDNEKKLSFIIPINFVKRRINGTGFVTFFIDTLTNNVSKVEIKKIKLFDTEIDTTPLNTLDGEDKNKCISYILNYLLKIKFNKNKNTKIYSYRSNPYKMTYRFNIKSD